MQNLIITIPQIRAARGLLGISQKELAVWCHMSVAAMNKIDRGLASPRVSTLQRMREVLEGKGVEFTAGQGVRLREDVLRATVYEGHDAAERYARFVLTVMRRNKKPAIHMTANEEELFPQKCSAFFDYYMQFRKYGLFERVLLADGAQAYYGPKDCAEYRTTLPEIASQVGMSVFGDHYCTMLPDKFVVIENASIADAYRAQFEVHWKNAKPMIGGKCLFDEEFAKRNKKR